MMVEVVREWPVPLGAPFACGALEPLEVGGTSSTDGVLRASSFILPASAGLPLRLFSSSPICDASEPDVAA